MRLAGSAAHRRGIKGRAKRLARWAGEYLSRNPGTSVADFQDALGQWLTAEIFPSDRIALERSSRFTHLGAADLERLRTPAETLHFFLDLALRHPAAFTAAYNDALNQVGFGLQRVKHEPATGRFTPPFFVELSPGGPGTPVYRYDIELTGNGPATITLKNPTAGDLEVRAPGRIRSALDFARALFAGLDCPEGVSIVGKAAPLAAELQRAPRGLGLPRQGSKYAPMVDHLIGGLRARGVLDQPTGLLIRIGLNTLDRLEAMGDLPLRLPRFLEGPLGRRVPAREVARSWRRTAGEARALLALLGRCHFGQHVHLVKALALNARGGDWEAACRSDHRLAALHDRLAEHPGGDSLLRALGADAPRSVADCIDRLSARRAALLAARRAAPQAISPEAARERERIECQLLVLFAAYVRRLWQRAESLPYVNDRPYTLALYLLFGREIFPPICREVEFDVEYLSPTIQPEGPAEPEREVACCGKSARGDR